MFSNFDNGFAQAQREYEDRMFNPYDYMKSPEDYEREAQEEEEARIAWGEHLFEEARLAEMDEDILWNV